MDKKPLHEQLRDYSEPPQLEAYEVPSQALAAFNQAMGVWIADGAHGFWMPPGSVDGHSEPEDFIKIIASRLSALSCAYNGRRTQSPIEDMLLGALLWLNADWADFPHFDLQGEGPEGWTPRDFPLQADLWLTAQAPVAGYKADFLLWFTCGKAKGGVVIECDGHDFHEKTKEQAARDKKRDREILKAGYPVMRFSGSEVYKDPAGCVAQVKEVLAEVLFRVSKDGGLF